MKITNNIYISIISLFTSGIIVGLMSFLFQFVIIKSLSIEDFSVFASLMSMINIFSILAIGLLPYITKNFSKNKNSLNLNNIKKYIFYGSIVGAALYGVFILNSPLIGSYLKIENTGLIILSGSLLFIYFLGLYQAPYLQVRGKFHLISIYQALGPIIRLLIGGMIFLGFFGLNAAIISIILPYIIVFILRYVFIRSDIKTLGNSEVNDDILQVFKTEKKQILQYLFTSILIALLMNIDILIVKNMFNGETAGYYAAISVLAKFLIFLGLSIETVYYPKLVKGKKIPTKDIFKISGYYIILLVGALIFFLIFGEMILKLFKDGLQEYIGVIFPLLIYCGILGYISIIIKTLIAFEKYLVNSILLVTIVCIISATYTYATDIYSLSYIFMFGSMAGLLACLGSLFLIKNSGE